MNSPSDNSPNALDVAAAAKRHLEIVEILMGKVDINAINLNGSTALDILFDLGQEHVDTILEEMIRRAGGRRAAELDTFQSHFTRQIDRLQSVECMSQISSSLVSTEILFYLPRRIFDFGKELSRSLPNYKDSETSNTLMVVATLIVAIAFQSALNPPGGFIEHGEDSGMAVMEHYLAMYLLYDVMGFISSLSVILLTIYVVPRWKSLIKLAMFLTWVSVFFIFKSFQHAVAVVFGHIIRHPLIVACLCIGDGIVLLFALVMFIYTWYLFHSGMATLLRKGSTKGTVGKSTIIAITCLASLGAALVWFPIFMLDIRRYYRWFA